MQPYAQANVTPVENTDKQQQFAPANGIMMVPIAQYCPAFATMVPVEPYHGIPGDMSAILSAAHTLQIRQHVKLLPKKWCSCPPGVKQENTYSVYAGFNESDVSEFMRIDEVSDDWNRCCCTPFHPLKLEARQYIPPPGSTDNTSDWAHLKGDVVKDFSTFGAADMQRKMHDMYGMYPPLFTIVRNDGQRCCCKCPCKLLNTFVCAGCCQDGATVYAGAVESREDIESGRPIPGTSNYIMGSIIQPIYGGCYKPEMHLFDEGMTAEATAPYGKFEGPCMFAGWSEMCCSFEFATSFFGSPSKTGDIAMITKKKPASAAGVLRELVSQADNYSISFNQAVKLSLAQKTTVLASQVLADYMFFDGSTEKCEMGDNGVTCYLCYFSCIGALCPFKVFIPYPPCC